MAAPRRLLTLIAALLGLTLIGLFMQAMLWSRHAPPVHDAQIHSILHTNMHRQDKGDRQEPLRELEHPAALLPSQSQLSALVWSDPPPGPSLGEVSIRVFQEWGGGHAIWLYLFTRNNSYPLTSVRLTPSACASISSYLRGGRFWHGTVSPHCPPGRLGVC